MALSTSIFHSTLSEFASGITPSAEEPARSKMSQKILMKEFQELSSEKWLHIELENENIYHWNIALIVLNPESMYHGAYLKAKLTIPKEYPYLPPEFKFFRPLFHPNVYPDGELCISILHAPGEDTASGELASERWSPAQRIESVLISILSLLDDAEVSSPANVDAGVMLRTAPNDFKFMVKHDVEKSQRDIPKGFVMPDIESTKSQATTFNDDEFLYDSAAEESSGDDMSEIESTQGQQREEDEGQKVSAGEYENDVDMLAEKLEDAVLLEEEEEEEEEEEL